MWNTVFGKSATDTSCHCCLLTKLCLTCCDLMSCILPGSSVHGTSRERISEWAAISFSRGSCWSRDQICISCTGGGFFTTEPPGKPSYLFSFSPFFKPRLSRCSQLESFQIATVSFWQDPIICCWKETHWDISSGNLNINLGDKPKLLCFITFYLASQLAQWKVPWSRKWQPTPVFLPGESHGQRGLAGYSP